MLKVIIADDEARVCSLIKMLIDWDSLGLSLSGTATNGIEALELIEQCKPDILITDIRMPGCSGLELIEKSKTLCPNMEVIIISGYAHFEYAQKAIQFGVGDYLLKPINQQQLTDTLRKLGERCRSRHQMSGEIEELRRNSQEDTKRLKNRMLQDLLSGSLNEISSESLWEKYHFRQETEWMQLALFQFDYDSDAISQTTLRIIEENAMQVCVSQLADLCTLYMTSVADGSCAVLLGLNNSMQDQCRHALRKCLNRISAQAGLSGEIEFTIALSPAVRDPAGLTGIVPTTRAILMERLISGTGGILDSLPPSSPWKTEDRLKPFRQVLMTLPQIQTTQVIEDTIDSLVQDVSGWSDARGENIFELVRTAGHLFLQQPPVSDGREKYERFAARIEHIGHASQLFDALRSMVLKETEDLILQQQNASTRPIRMAQDYVLKHYSEPLTLEIVCDQVGLSASYFSYLYKKETGENFLHYLTRVRMDRAKELLSQTNLSISQISEQVGYSDSNYFTKMFKRETKISPGQYRKLYN